ncbi:MAG: nitroreductase family protein [Candidatus Omnitrophica bacterium]|nr:nitroreductase family protein [Candidatus Omnitrophota bacterium]
MDFWDVVTGRRSVRSFLDKPVSDGDIGKIVAAAAVAPSAGDQKNWRFIAVKDTKLRGDMREAVISRINGLTAKMASPRARKEFLGYSRYFTFFADAPCVMAVVMTPYDSLTGRILARVEGDKLYISTAGLQSVSAAVENLVLAAEALGLGSCWMTGPMLARFGLEKILGINSPDQLIALVPIGYPKTEPKPNKPPKDLDSILTYL